MGLVQLRVSNYSHLCARMCFIEPKKTKKTVSGWGFTPDITVKLTTLPTPFNKLGGVSTFPDITLSTPTYAQSGRAPQYFPQVGVYGPSDDVGR